MSEPLSLQLDVPKVPRTLLWRVSAFRTIVGGVLGSLVGMLTVGCSILMLDEGVVGGPVGKTGCFSWPRLGLVALQLQKIYPGDKKDVPFVSNYYETAKEYRARLPHVKRRDEIDALLHKTPFVSGAVAPCGRPCDDINEQLRKSRFPGIELACLWGDAAEVWRDTCPPPETFFGVKKGYPRAEGLAYAWLICDSARDLGLVGARR